MIRERENMPEISNISLNANLNTFSRHFDKKSSAKKSILETCQVCSKLYDKQTTNKLLADITTIPNFIYENTCLICLKETSQKTKANYQPSLKKAKEELTELTIAYQKAHKHYKTLSAIYQKYDYLENIINHHLTKPAKTKKIKTSEQIKKATALKILNSLTPAQRVAILADMKQEQTSC